MGAALTLVAACGEDPDRVIYFPQHEDTLETDRGNGHFFGELVVVDGCLRADANPHRDVSFLLVWPPGFTVKTEDDAILILDGEGQIAAQVGDDVRFSGRSVRSEDDRGRELRQRLPTDCRGHYWIVGDEVSPVEPDEPTVVPLPGSTLFFPRQKTVKGERATMLAELVGELVVVNDCLRVRRGEPGSGRLLVWPPGFTPSIEDGVVQVRDGAGRVVARVGDEVRMVAGQIPALFLDEQARRVVRRDCDGPYWGVGEIVSSVPMIEESE